jgi:hypothetical protein
MNIFKSNIKSESIDYALIFLVTSVFTIFSRVTWLRMMVLVLLVCYLFWQGKIKASKINYFLLSFIFVVLLVSLFAPLSSLILRDVIASLMTNVFLFISITSLVMDLPRSKWVFKIALLSSIAFIYIFYLPLIIASEESFRIQSTGFFDLFQYPANFLSFLTVLAHVLTHQIYQNVSLPTQGMMKTKVIYFTAQMIWFSMGLFTISRSYFIILIFTVLIFSLLKFREKIHFKWNNRVVITTTLLSALFIMILLVSLSSLSQFFSTIDLSTVNNGLQYRFYSLAKLVFNDHQIIDISTLNRLRLLQNASEVSYDHSLFGVGFNAFRYYAGYGFTYGKHLVLSNHAHSELAEVLSSIGSIGLIFLLIFYQQVLIRIKSHKLFYAFLLAVLFTSIFFNVYYDKRVWWIFLALLWNEGASHETH